MCLIVTRKHFRSYAWFQISQIPPVVPCVSLPSPLISSFPVLLIMKIIGCYGNSDVVWGCGCPKEIWRSSKNLWCLEWNGWLARMFGRDGVYQHNAWCYIVSDVACADDCVLESKLPHLEISISVGYVLWSARDYRQCQQTNNSSKPHMWQNYTPWRNFVLKSRSKTSLLPL